MRYFSVLAFLSFVCHGRVYASGYGQNEALFSCPYDDTCTSSGYEGVCVSSSAGCCSSGVTTSGLCPGSSDIKCCTQSKCSSAYGAGTCMQTSLCSSKGGKSYSGYCTGPSDLQCCVTDPTPVTGHFGVDVSVLITTSIASCFKSSGIEYVIPRGYRSNGQVDTNACPSIINAANIGIKRRDVYLFPCKPLYSEFSFVLIYFLKAQLVQRVLLLK
jgi:hypothetical protein